MRTSIIFKGIGSLSFDMTITYLDRRQRAEEIIDRFQIPYSNTEYLVHRGKYRPYERVMRGVLFDLSQKNDVSDWLRGNGVLKTSNDEDGYFRASVVSGIKWDKIAPEKEQFELTFLINPAFFYLDSGIAPQLLTTPATVINEGTNTSTPLIEITGTGDVSVDVNGEIFNITGLSGTITIDSEIMEVWEDTVLSDKMAGAFPILQTGTNNIAWTGTVTEFRLIPRWNNL